MLPRKTVVVLLIVLAGSLLLNALLALAARHYYVEGKRRSVEPTFAQHFRQKHPAVSTNDGRPLIALFGDSRIAGWQPAPSAEGYDILNRGIGGETTAQMVYRFHSDVVALAPKLVIIQAGINDLVAAGLSPDMELRVYKNTIANLTAMVLQAKSSGIRVVLLTIIPPARPDLMRRLVWSDRIPALVAEANLELASLHAPPLVEVVDTQSILQSPPGTWKPDVVLDTLHLAPAGYNALNDALARVILKH